MTFREKIKKEEAVLGAYDMGGKIAVAFLIEVMYKNGVVREFWCSEFTKSHGTYTWVSIFAGDCPIYMNAEDVSSVWQKDMVIVTELDYKNSPLALSMYKKVFEGE